MNKKTLLHLFGTLLIGFWMVGCANLEPRIISSKDYDVKNRLVFNASQEEVVKASKEVFKLKEWDLFYEGEEKPSKTYSYFSSHGGPFNYKNYDNVAWNQSLMSKLQPTYYITGKTPTSAFSFGAEFFIVLYSSDDHITVAQVTMASNQIAEKDKLEGYIQEYAALLNEQLNKSQ